MLANAFHLLLKLHSRPMTIERPGNPAVPLRVTPSNYFRNTEAPEETVIKGREFVVSKKAVVDSGFTLPIKRGDVLRDPELGKNAITDVREMYDFGGNILGYRLRTA